jgi:hypothetical protein
MTPPWLLAAVAGIAIVSLSVYIGAAAAVVATVHDKTAAIMPDRALNPGVIIPSCVFARSTGFV